MESTTQQTDAHEDVISKLTRDLRAAVKTLNPNEVRFLVDSYYTMQDNRIRAAGQVRSMATSGEPHLVLDWLQLNSERLEGQVKSALDAYSRSSPVGQWARAQKGIGPVLAAGLLAHIDITKAPTVGHIWRFAGLDPTRQWLGRVKAEELVSEKWGDNFAETVAKIALEINVKPEQIEAQLTDDEGKISATKAKLISAIAKCPWNASLKVLCWKIGESFVKVSGLDDAFYGKTYVARKVYESEKNERLEYKEQALKHAARVGKDTEAYKHYSKGKLSPGHLHSRAKRYAVKLFLAHLHQRWYEWHFKKPAPLPYPIAHLGHTHIVEPPGPSI